MRYQLNSKELEQTLASRRIFMRLTATEKESLKTLTESFLQKKTFEAARGLALTETMKVVIAAQACLPVLNLGLSWYDNWTTTVVTPASFISENTEIDNAGVVHEWLDHDAGESWERGPVALSWEDVEDSGLGDGYNVVIHEAAHRLDITDDEMNGRPALPPEVSPRRWFNVMSAAYKDFSRRVERGLKVRLDEYAAEDDAEFFAVSTEYFFEKPRILSREYPEVYGLLKDFYLQDPAAPLRR